MAERELFAWKFIIPQGQWASLPNEPSFTFSGFMAVAVAATAEEARAVLHESARLTGKDSRWLDTDFKTVKQPLRLRIDGPAAIAWAEV